MKLHPSSIFNTKAFRESQGKKNHWGFIDQNLFLYHMSENDLMDLFDISKTALNHWKNDNRNVSLDKIAVLCQLFGITLDQFYERDFNDDIVKDIWSRFAYYDKVRDWKNIKAAQLSSFFFEITIGLVAIEHFGLGYQTFYLDENVENVEIDPEDIAFYCKNLDIDIGYDLKDKTQHYVKTVSYNELCSISNKLKADWGDECTNHISAYAGKKYVELALRSENIAVLSETRHSLLHPPISLLNYWEELKESDPSFDKDYSMAKTLLAYKETFEDENGEPDLEKTLALCNKILSKEMFAKIDEIRELEQKELAESASFNDEELD